jgi:hypothetical protein
MSYPQERARRVYDTLSQDPALLYELLALVNQHRRRIAGPWTKEHDGRHKRVGPTGTNIAAINYLKDGNWRWTVSLRSTPVNGVSHERLEQGVEPNEAEAKRKADLLLAENVWRFSELDDG